MLAVFLDLETTGLDFRKHRILEIAFKVMDVLNGELKAEYQSIIYQSAEVWDQRDLKSIEVNGFQWEELAKGNSEFNVSQQISTLLNSFGLKRGSAVFICQNPAFDRSFFAQLVDVYTQETWQWPYHWLDLASMYWVLKVQHFHQHDLLFPMPFSLSKNFIAEEYHLSTEKYPHRAMNGVDHLILCYRAVVGFKNV